MSKRYVWSSIGAFVEACLTVNSGLIIKRKKRDDILVLQLD